MLQLTTASTKGKNKATDLKKLIQIACNSTQRPRKEEPLVPLADKSKDNKDMLLNKSKCSEESNKSSKSIKSITLTNKLKAKPINACSTGNLRDK